MAKVGRELIDVICLNLCDGCGGRCQRYPELSESCEEFVKFLKAYEAGIEQGWKEAESRYGIDTG